MVFSKKQRARLCNAYQARGKLFQKALVTPGAKRKKTANCMWGNHILCKPSRDIFCTMLKGIKTIEYAKHPGHDRLMEMRRDHKLGRLNSVLVIGGYNVKQDPYFVSQLLKIHDLKKGIRVTYENGLKLDTRIPLVGYEFSKRHIYEANIRHGDNVREQWDVPLGLFCWKCMVLVSPQMTKKRCTCTVQSTKKLSWTPRRHGRGFKRMGDFN